MCDVHCSVCFYFVFLHTCTSVVWCLWCALSVPHRCFLCPCVFYCVGLTTLMTAGGEQHLEVVLAVLPAFKLKHNTLPVSRDKERVISHFLLVKTVGEGGGGERERKKERKKEKPHRRVPLGTAGSTEHRRSTAHGTALRCCSQSSPQEQSHSCSAHTLRWPGR